MAESPLGSLWTMGMAQLGLGAPAEQAAAGTTPASPGGRDVEARAQQQSTPGAVCVCHPHLLHEYSALPYTKMNQHAFVH